MSTKLVITLPGYDALTETDPRKKSLDSELFEHMMRLEAAQGSSHAITAAIGTDTITIPHNLGYRPFFAVYIYWDDAFLGATDIQDGSFYIVDPLYANFDYVPKVDDTNIYLRIFNASGQGGMTLHYYYAIGRDPV